MEHYYWNTWYLSWGWILWYAILLLVLSSAGNWGYTYRAHRKYSGDWPVENALSILKTRYAKGEIKHEEYSRMKAELLT